MRYLNKIISLWSGLREKAQPKASEFGGKMASFGKKLSGIWTELLKLKKVILAIPVAAAAVILAVQNMARLPEFVGINLLESGSYSFEVIKLVAVLGPAAITAVCLLLMFISKRVLTPWFVSLVSLALPVIILLTNTFPA